MNGEAISRYLVILAPDAETVNQNLPALPERRNLVDRAEQPSLLMWYYYTNSHSFPLPIEPALPLMP